MRVPITGLTLKTVDDGGHCRTGDEAAIYPPAAGSAKPLDNNAPTTQPSTSRRASSLQLTARPSSGYECEILLGILGYLTCEVKHYLRQKRA
jgi:hypothetical protein